MLSLPGVDRLVSMKLQISWKTVLFPVLGLLAFFLYLYIFRVDIPTIVATARRIDLFTYSLAVAALVSETFVFSLSWRFLLNFLSVKLSVMKCFLYVWFGIFVDTLIPAESVSGEISRVYLVAREQNGSSGKVVASLVVHRLIGMGINIGGLLVGVVFMAVAQQPSTEVFNLTLFLAIVTTAFLVLLLLLSLKERWTVRILNSVISVVERLWKGRWKFSRIRAEVSEALKMFHSSIREYGRAPKTVVTSLSLCVLSWFLNLSVTYLVFSSMKYTVPWGIIIVTHSIVIAVKSIPLGVPFEAGLPEITMSTLYIFFGVPPGLSATATILNRILTVWLRFFIGFMVQQWLGIKSLTTISADTNPSKKESNKT